MADFTSEVKRTFTTIRDDMHSTRFATTFRRESKEIKDFYLTEEQRQALDRMKGPSQWFTYSRWVFKALFYKLTPFRRLLFLLGLMMSLGFSFSEKTMTFTTNGLFGGALLVVVIVLELKDKLLAHDELSEGRQIQELLMPDRVQDVEGWSIYLFTRSANEVCGDLVDFLRLERPQTAVVIADVAGKGLHAALLTAKLQATLRALAFDTVSMRSLIARVNTIFHRDSPSRMFASLVYAAISETDGEIRYVNAGHLPPIVVRNGVTEEMEKGELALGLTRTVEYKEGSVRLNTGDLFILYSDGVTEAKNEEGAFFGKERLTAVLKRAQGTPEQICRSIVVGVDGFMGNTAPSDDLSLIILKRTAQDGQQAS